MEKGMNRTIPTNFAIPKDYTKRFVFRGENGMIRIYRAGKRKLRIDEAGVISEQEQSAALDWIHESVERMRFESEP